MEIIKEPRLGFQEKHIRLDREVVEEQDCVQESLDVGQIYNSRSFKMREIKKAACCASRRTNGSTMGFGFSAQNVFEELDDA